jgi:hypothetical protein
MTLAQKIQSSVPACSSPRWATRAGAMSEHSATNDRRAGSTAWKAPLKFGGVPEEMLFDVRALVVEHDAATRKYEVWVAASVAGIGLELLQHL